MPWIHRRLSCTLLLSAVAHASLLLAWPAPVVPVPVPLSVTFLREPLPSRENEAPSEGGLTPSPHQAAAVSPPATASATGTRQPTLAVPAGDPTVPVMVPPAPVLVPPAVPTPTAGPALVSAPVGDNPNPLPAAPLTVPAGEPSALQSFAPQAGGAGEAAVGGRSGAADQDSYRGSLAGQARRLKRYPPLARERGWQGTVEVEVSAHGAAVPVFRVQRSSGYVLLDQQALELMAQAARLVVVPESLRRTGFRFVLPVVYRLDD